MSRTMLTTGAEQHARAIANANAAVASRASTAGPRRPARSRAPADAAPVTRMALVTGWPEGMMKVVGFWFEIHQILSTTR